MRLIIGLILFLVITLAPRVSAAATSSQQKPTPTVIQVSQSSTLESELELIQKAVSALRDENYERAIRAAEQAGDKADRFINTVVGLATIFGLVLTAVSVVFGGSIATLIAKLNAHVSRAKKGADLVDKLYGEAKGKLPTLKKTLTELEAKAKELEGLEAGKTKDRKELDAIKSKIAEIQRATEQAQGTINEIQTLRNSARYVTGPTGPSGATIGTMNVGDTGIGSGYAGISLTERKCKYCRRPESDFWGDESQGVGGLLSQFYSEYVCPDCRRLGRS